MHRGKIYRNSKWELSKQGTIMGTKGTETFINKVRTDDQINRFICNSLHIILLHALCFSRVKNGTMRLLTRTAT